MGNSRVNAYYSISVANLREELIVPGVFNANYYPDSGRFYANFNVQKIVNLTDRIERSSELIDRAFSNNLMEDVGEIIEGWQIREIIDYCANNDTESARVVAHDIFMTVRDYVEDLNCCDEEDENENWLIDDDDDEDYYID